MSHVSKDGGGNSSLAAALQAMMPDSEPDLLKSDADIEAALESDVFVVAEVVNATPEDQLVIDACRALAMAGVRPGARSVTAYLREKHGTAPRKEVVVPIVRHWKAAQWKSAPVRAAFLAYAQLDAEERAAFKLRMETDDLSLAAAESQPEASHAFEIRILYRGGRMRTETADRATVAWAKFQNLIDRHPADVERLELHERSNAGTRVIRKWKTGGNDIASWQ